jgi:O-antigen biosynthesis protein
MIEWLFPKYTYRRLVVSKIIKFIAYYPNADPFYRVSNFFSVDNIRLFLRFSGKSFICNVCGSPSSLYYDFPNIKNRKLHGVGVLRETLQCRECGCTMRDRSLASVLILSLNKKLEKQISSIEEIVNLDVDILDTDSFSPLSKILLKFPRYIRSSYKPDMPFGLEIDTNRFNINLEHIDFIDGRFDIVMSSDVVEHIRDVDKAHSEISRVLRNNGEYIFTVPFDPNCLANHELVDTSGENDIYLVPKQIHGDPLTGGVLAYRVFGQKIFGDLERVLLKATFKEISIPENGIFFGDVFWAQKI